MTKEINQPKLNKLAHKVLKTYPSKVALINKLHEIGVDRHQCMILELVLLGKNYTSIKRTLLFTKENFLILVNSLFKSLKDHKKNVKLHDKLVGR